MAVPHPSNEKSEGGHQGHCKAGDEGQHLLLLLTFCLKTTDFMGAESPELALRDPSVLSVQRGRVGGDGPAPGRPMWA